MEIKSEIISGKRRIIITKSASGIDKAKDAVLMVMGPEWYFPDDISENKDDKVTA